MPKKKTQRGSRSPRVAWAHPARQSLPALRTCCASRFANNCAAALAARGRGTTVTRSPASEEKALHAPPPRNKDDPPDRG